MPTREYAQTVLHPMEAFGKKLRTPWLPNIKPPKVMKKPMEVKVKGVRKKVKAMK